MLGLIKYFQTRFGISKEVQVSPSTLFAEVDQVEFEEYKAVNKNANVKEFLADVGTYRILSNQQDVPDKFVTVEKGWAVKMRLN